MAALKKVNMLPKNRGAQIAVELAMIFFALQAALPAALAVYPQVLIVHVVHNT